MTFPATAALPDDVTDRPFAMDGRALPPGTWLDEFEVGEVIAEGSAAIVYAATDDTLAVPVVIAEYMPLQLAQRGDDLRVVPNSPAHNHLFALGLRAFIADSRILARCDHPSLVRILRLRESNATAYRVMPRYTASSLLDVRRGMKDPPDEQSLRTLLDALLGALDAYHRAGGFHGKVTASNILLLGNDRPLLLSPGGAGRAITDDPLMAPEATSAPSFAPIEQLVESPDMPLGPSADLYALAGVARYWISGDLPPPAVGPPGAARRETLDAMMERLQKRWPHLQYAPWLIDALESAWSIYPAGRPQSVTEMRVRMNAALQDDFGRTEAQTASAGGRPGGTYTQDDTTIVRAEHRASASATSAPAPALSAEYAAAPVSRSAEVNGQHETSKDNMAAAAMPPAAATSPEAADDDASGYPVVVDVALEPSDVAHLDMAPDAGADADAVLFDAPDIAPIERPPPREENRVARVLLWMGAIFALLALAAAGTYVLNKQHRLDRLLDLLGIPHASSASAPARPAASRVAPPPAGSSVIAALSAPSPGPSATPAIAASTAAAPDASPGNPTSTTNPHSLTGGAAATLAPDRQPLVSPPEVTQTPATAPATSPTQPAGAARSADRAAQQAARDLASPRDACGGRTEFALYRCMQTQCALPRWTSHSQCERLRATDQVD